MSGRRTTRGAAITLAAAFGLACLLIYWRARGCYFDLECRPSLSPFLLALFGVS